MLEGPGNVVVEEEEEQEKEDADQRGLRPWKSGGKQGVSWVVEGDLKGTGQSLRVILSFRRRGNDSLGYFWQPDCGDCKGWWWWWRLWYRWVYDYGYGMYIGGHGWW